MLFYFSSKASRFTNKIEMLQLNTTEYNTDYFFFYIN